MMVDLAELVPTGEASRLLGISPTALHLALERGALPYVKLPNGHRLVRRNDVAAFGEARAARQREREVRRPAGAGRQ